MSLKPMTFEKLKTVYLDAVISLNEYYKEKLPKNREPLVQYLDIVFEIVEGYKQKTNEREADFNKRQEETILAAFLVVLKHIEDTTGTLESYGRFHAGLIKAFEIEGQEKVCKSVTEIDYKDGKQLIFRFNSMYRIACHKEQNLNKPLKEDNPFSAMGEKSKMAFITLKNVAENLVHSYNIEDNKQSGSMLVQKITPKKPESNTGLFGNFFGSKKHQENSVAEPEASGELTK